MNIHFVVHEAFEAPGAYEKWAISRGHKVSYTRLYLGEQLPEDTHLIDWLIIMGGPQSPQTTMTECPHFNASAEITLIQTFIKQAKPVIGVCLGAQLLGEAFGAHTEHSPHKEIGNFPIFLTEEGLSDNNLLDFGQSLTVGHWHGDMPGLSETAQVLASSAGCPRQIIKYTDKHYAFQCHLELSHNLVQDLLAEEVAYEQQVVNHRYVQPAQDILSYNYDEMNHALEIFLDRFIDTLSKKG